MLLNQANVFCCYKHYSTLAHDPGKLGHQAPNLPCFLLIDYVQMTHLKRLVETLQTSNLNMCYHIE